MKFFHINWPPQTRWGYRLVSRLRISSDSGLQNRFNQHWPKEQMIAFATKLALVRVIQRRFNEDVAKLGEEIANKKDEIQRCVPEHKALRLADTELAFRLVANIDAFIFEARSAYEILGSVVRDIAGDILGTKVHEKTLREILKTKGDDTGWIDDLRDERIRFFHRTAPWFAMKVTDMDPPYEILVLRRNSYDLEADVGAAFPLAMLEGIFFGLDRAADVIEKWLLEGIEQAEKRL